MIFTLAALRETAERRLPGYLEEATRIGTPLDGDHYELTSEQIASLAKYRKPIGFGDAVKATIHAALDIVPMSTSTRSKIKGCSGCAARAARLNAAIPNINPFDQVAE